MSVEKERIPIVAIIAIALLTFLGVLTETSMNVAFPTLMHQFHVSLAAVQWLTTGYLLANSILMLASAFFNKRFKARYLFFAAAFFFGVGDCICATATQFPVLLFGRIIQAGGVGFSGPLLTNLILATVPSHRLGTYLGFANLIILVGPALGPSFGGLIVNVASWRLIFWSTLPLAIILVVIGAPNIKQYAKTAKYAFNWLQFSLLSTALVSVMVVISLLAVPTQWLASLLLFLVAVMSAGAFIVVAQKPTSKHFLNVNIFRQPIFLLSFIPYVFMQFSNLSMNFLLPNFVQIVGQASPFIGGLILLPGSIINGLGQPVYGWLLDQYGGKLPLYVGNTCFLLAATTLMIWIPTLSISLNLLVYLLFSSGRSLAFSNTMTFSLKRLSPQVQADANAVYSTGQQVMGAAGTNVTAVLMSSVHFNLSGVHTNLIIGSRIMLGLIVVRGKSLKATFPFNDGCS
ncbi:MFS transporter [Secundilactobacillus kimchicus]|uniref:MFS transporter n=2 Tax=Secundilactobacillus kimchicus TaxID=528209 RepID=UPI0024A994FE|nr:MFS transporter [Secundilactobacillus kimchicus]